MASTLRLPGQAVPSGDHRDLERVRNVVEVQVLAFQAVTGARGATAQQTDLAGAEDDDVVELQFEDGITQWTTVAQLRADGHATRGANTDVLEIPAAFPRTRGAERGVWDWVLRGLRVLRIDPEKKLADIGLDKLLDRIEGQQQPAPALYRVGEKGTLTESIQKSGDLDAAAGPWLVFIHGTASSTDGSFGKLFDKPEWQQLYTRYAGRVLALQHKSLSVSPAANALDLATLLPKNATLHLITHSRGGLVGELLCLGDFDDAALSSFSARYKDDVERLKSLRTLIRDKAVTVEKFVRVACPARGTILASRRLDIYFTVILNLLGRLIPGNPVYALLKGTMLELLKRRTNPDELPGLEAMMPESPFVHFLNKGLSSQADLGVIAGDQQGDSFFTRLKAFATDIYYLQEHDLVVNTSAMFGGMGRPKGAWGFYDQGPKVNHFSYFENEKTRARLYGWLTSKEHDPAFKAFDPRIGGIPIDATRGARAARGTEAPLPVAVIVPDVFGTTLEQDGEIVWPDVPAIARKGLASLALTGGAKPGALVGRVYEPLVRSLSVTHDVVAFAYDWRRSLDDSADALDETLKAWRGRSLRIVAHGSGGLVVRAWQSAYAKSWEKFPDARVVFLGTPLRGQFAAVEWLTGRSRLARMLELANGTANESLANGAEAATEAGKWFRSLPGIVQLVPDAYLNADAWPAPGEAPTAALLDKARGLRITLSPPGADVLAVVGRDVETAIGFAPTPAEVSVTANGDGRVDFADAVLPPMKAWRVEAPHGDLTTYAGAFPAYLDLLSRGETAKLSRPQGIRSAPANAPSHAAEPLLFPTSEELAIEAFALGRSGAAGEDIPLTVSVTHADLRMVRFPVMVGHYVGDSIVSAEAVLDRHLGLRLSRRFQMGLYPNTVGTVEIIRAPRCSPPGALIIGLGQVGSVTLEVVRRGVAEAALRYALSLAEDADGGGEVAGWRSAAFSSVLIATNGGNGITLEESITAVIQGALDANRTLRRQDQWKLVRIDAVEFVEVYEQLARRSVYAAQAAQTRLQGELEQGERIEVVNVLRSTESGQFRTPPEAAQTGWWQRLFITGGGDTVAGKDNCKSDGKNDGKGDGKGKEDGKGDGKIDRNTGNTPLKYVVITDRARAEATLQCRERNIVRSLIQSAVTSSTFDATLSGALFEMLLPNEIKTTASRVSSVVLTLDRDTAQIPWEMLSDGMERGSGEARPPFSVRAGLLRQFETSTYRVDPRAADVRTAFVVGDTKSGYAVLKGAQDEAEEVNRVLTAAGFGTTHLPRPDPATFITQFYARPYRILHIAAHGNYDCERPSESGVVLDKDQQMYLTACQVRQMRTIPDLVFINCCYLAAIDDEARPHLLAASVAEELINMGVKAVVVAGWAVDDRAALTFASTFYRCMLEEKRPFGESVRRARAAVYVQHPGTNTWAAYQCYGNPGFLLADLHGVRPTSSAGPYCSKGEYIDEIRSLAAEAKARVDDRGATTEVLEAFLDRVPESWRDGELLAQAGFAWQSLGDDAQAIASFDAAFRHEDGLAPLSALEQLFNMVTRRAANLAGDPAKVAEVAELQARAAKLKEVLMRLPSTPERAAQFGSYLKKQSLITKNLEESDRLITESVSSYRTSADLLRQAGASPQYPLLNYIPLEWVRDADAAPRLLQELEQIRDLVHATAKRGNNFWDYVGEADLALAFALLKGALQIEIEAIAGLYEKAAAKGGPGGTQWSSVYEHLDWIATQIERRHRDGAPVRALLARLKRDVASAGPQRAKADKADKASKADKAAKTARSRKSGKRGRKTS